MKILRIAAIVLVIIGSALAGAAFKVKTFVEPKPQTIKESISFAEESGTINILLIGIDEVDGGRRADAIAFTTIDIDGKITRFMSIPRDTRVQLPRKGWDKIAHAYAYGGVDLLRETVVNYLGLPINYYILVNYDTFPAIVNLIGGVEMDVATNMVYNDYSGKLFINIKKGRQLLDGKNALHYVRFRHDAQGDIGRVKRQQDFVKAVLEKLQSPSMIPKIPELAAKVIEMINSDMTPAQGLQLASYMVSMPSENFHFFTLPGKAAYISNLSYWVGDTMAASKLLTDILEEHDDPEPGEGEEGILADTDKVDIEAMVSSISTPVAVLNGAGTAGLGKTVATALQKIGIDVQHIGNARHFDYRSTSIHLPSNPAEEVVDTGKTLATLLGISSALVSRTPNVTHATIVIGKDNSTVLGRLEKLASRK
ncbi:MAG: LCP family protein [Synergistaceae bacterium]|nr:LCP family protein [Synergistota bacterium]NLM70615.1 LCP family protein [Synergistaceae bacterium]